MNRYALLKDSINDSIFGVIVDSNGLSKFYGVSAKGLEWSKWANGINVKSENNGLPIGVVVGGYSALRNTNPNYVQALVDTVSLRNPSINKKQGISDSLIKNSSSVVPSVRDAELRAFDIDKRNEAIAFKARAFRTDSKVSSLLTQVRAERLGFVSNEGVFSSRNPIHTPEVKQAEIIDSYGRSLQRAIGLSLIRKKSVKMLAVVRKDQALAKSFGIEFKAASIGPKIGSRLSGGLRAAPAGMSFVDVTGVTDADTDGIVFEGKPGLERPIIPRFMVPKDLARKLSGIVEGDAEVIEKQRRAGNTSVQFDEGKLRNIIASVGGDANMLTALTGENGIPLTTPSGRERLSVSAPSPTGIARDVARDAVIGSRVRSGQRSDLGDATPLSSGELKKLSQQELVDRLIEDRNAGLNLEEAAKKYGLKGGRVEARRLEAREMSRRDGGMRSRSGGMRSRNFKMSGAPKEIQDSYSEDDIKKIENSLRTGGRQDLRLSWDSENNGWMLYSFSADGEVFIEADAPLVRLTDWLSDVIGDRYDPQTNDGEPPYLSNMNELLPDEEDRDDSWIKEYPVSGMRSRSGGMRSRSGYDEALDSEFDYEGGGINSFEDYLNHPEFDKDFVEWLKDNPGKTKKDFIDDPDGAKEYFSLGMEAAEMNTAPESYFGTSGMRSRTGGMRSNSENPDNQIHMTSRELNAVDDRLSNIIESGRGGFNAEEENALNDFKDSIDNAGAAFDSIVMDDDVRDTLIDLFGNIAKNGDDPNGDAKNLLGLLESVRDADDNEFVTDELDRLGTMHDMNFDDSAMRAPGGVSRAIRRAMANRRGRNDRGMRSRTEPLFEAERLSGNDLSPAQDDQLFEAAMDSRRFDPNSLNDGEIDSDWIMDALNYNFYNTQVNDDLAADIEDLMVERDNKRLDAEGRSSGIAKDNARSVIKHWQDSVDDDPDKMGELLSSYEGDLVAAMDDHYDDYLNGQLDTFENRRESGMRSRSGGMRSSNYTTMDDIGTTDSSSRKRREEINEINSRLDREPVLNGRILRINELVSYQPGKQGHEAMSNEIANHIAKTRDTIYDAVLSGDIDTEEADDFIYQMFDTLDSPLQEVFGEDNRGRWNNRKTDAQEKFEKDFTSDAEERFKKAAVIAESMGALKKLEPDSKPLPELDYLFNPRENENLINEADQYIDDEWNSLVNWSEENPLADSDEVYSHWADKIKEQTRLLEDDDLNEFVDDSLKRGEEQFSNFAYENKQKHLAGRADAVMRGAGMRSRSGMRSNTATEQRPYFNVSVTGSSALRQASYDAEKEELVVTYANGKTYTYKNFSNDDLDNALSGPDHVLTGTAVNQIKKNHDFREGGVHTFDPEYQDIQGPGGQIGTGKLSRLGRGEKTQIPVSGSSAIEALTWDDENEDLIVTYAGGRTYTYKDVDSYWIEDLERETGTGRIINNIKKEGYRVVDGGEHGDMPSEGLTAERAEFGMRSRMAPSSGRIRAAEMEISARPQGMASRRSEGLRDPRFAVPGRDRVDPSDGQLWGRLSDEEKATVADRAVNREKMLLNEFKQRFPRWWDRASKEADKKGWDKDLMNGGNAGWMDELHRFVTRLADDPDYPEKNRVEAEKQFNDLQALYNMRSNRGAHDLLEHLNPTSRRYLFDDARRDDSKKTRISASGKEMKTPSTAPRPLGDPIDTGTPIREQVGQNEKKPLKARLDAYYKRMSDKILYTDPARQARREMRKARRQGINAGGFTTSEANPVDDAKRKIRRRKRLKEMRKNRTRDIGSISDSSTGNRIDGRLAHTDSQGSLVLGEKLTSTLATMMKNYRTESKLKKTKGGVSRNRALAVLWDGAGYNGTPHVVTPEEFKALHAAGWVPVVRGHGSGANGVRYANDWIDDPVRFITGQGGEAQGEGEYWARPTQGGGGWFSWMDGSLPAGTVGLLPPSTRRVSKAELGKIKSEHAPLAKSIKAFDAGLPSGEREKMDAEEYVTQLRDHLRASLGPIYESTMSTKMGQMTSKILESLSGSSDSKKQELLDALEFLELISTKRTSNSYAPLLGYDTIMADSGVELIHNRTAITIVGDTLTRDDAVKLAKSKA